MSERVKSRVDLAGRATRATMIDGYEPAADDFEVALFSEHLDGPVAG